MINFEKFTLENGLRVIIYKDKTTPIAAFNVLYDVGARDESENRTGFAHLFEHLMFGGSKNIENYDTALQKAGGENNAFTNNDYTNYYITVPKQNIETAFYLESDRMLELAFSEKSLDVQRNVVSEEYRQRYLNQPYGDVSLFLRPLAYEKHPYKWSTIGKNIEDIMTASLSEVKDFFYKHYAPNNAVVVIAGDVDSDQMYELCKKWFGDIPNRNVPVRNLPEEPVQTSKRILTLERNVPCDAIFMAYHTVGRLDEEYYATDLISDLLSSGRSSLFNMNLVKGKQYFSELDAYISGSYHPGLLHVAGKLYPGVSFDNAEKAIKEEINKIVKGDFSEKDLNKVKNKSISAQNFSRIGLLNIAMELAYCEWLGDAGMINNVEEKYMSVTKKDIVKTAEKIFTDNNLSCIYYKAKQ
ncbi:MAG: insulinase family protein [Bacteroidales bacterium]|jgi:predicted Zn-dependent peptidase|nr:insulinase family protein [Bacteroidales bacterium]